YYDHNLPLNPSQLVLLLRHNLDALQNSIPAEDPDFVEFLSILFHLEHLPAYTESDAAAVENRHREKEVAKLRIAQLVSASPRIAAHIQQNLRTFNGDAGRPESFDRLHELLEVQPYRLASWRTAIYEINYRRFFDIQDLAAIRTEDADVFKATHE